jgi:hypothetical protein
MSEDEIELPIKEKSDTKNRIPKGSNKRTLSMLRFIGFSIKETIKGIAYRWVLAVIDNLRALLVQLKKFISRHKLEHADKNATLEMCGPIHNPSFHRPDPLIYSQKYLLSLGLAVTWDNPDIVLLRNGVIVPEGELLPDTEYEIDATIWNNSFDAPIVGLRVDFAFLSFGAGTTLHPIGTRVINLGVKGGINHPVHARIPWKTPPVGHYCIQVQLIWADDINPENNVGQNNVNVVSPHSPATFIFQLRNNTARRTTYKFPTDMYTLPTLKDCEKKIKRHSSDAKWKAIQALHDRSKYSVPQDWTIIVSPTTIELSPNEEVPIEVSIDPPSGFIGTRGINIHSTRDNDIFVGGITVYVTKT